MRPNKTGSLSSTCRMDSEKFDENREYQRVLDPEVRLKLITKNSNTVEIDASIPPRRYYKSGLEMVRMANVYLDEGSLENAFILYMKFMTFVS
ncbi:unnamed protein product [Nezara viridula]|uniref:USP8 dimerisation domain-containing protein n=1 Tax=Nezara viridula TaxID=85310 RepID=A0A9P0MX96_NEZVI|nr:unnamed protein product [Nezara viridula]